MSLSIEAATPDVIDGTRSAPATNPNPPLQVWWKRLKASPDGLSENAAHERLMKYGLNRLEQRHRNPVARFHSSFSGPIGWVFEIAAGISILADQTTEFIILLFLLLSNAAVGYWQEYRAANAVEAVKKQLAPRARVKRAGNWREIDAGHLVPGDVIRLRQGDIIPADVVLIQGDRLSVDQAALTGESLPVAKGPQDVGYSGSVVRFGEMDALVTHTGSHTYFGKSANLVSQAANTPRFRRVLATIGNYLTYLTLALAGLLFVVVLLRGSSDATLLRFALIFLVTSIPVAMPTALSLVSTLGARTLTKMKAIVTRPA